MNEIPTYGGSRAKYLAIEKALELWRRSRADLKKLECNRVETDAGLSQEDAKDDLITRLLEHDDMEEAEAAKVKKLTCDESTTVILTELL